MKSPWEKCTKCKGGCDECNHLGRKLKSNAKLCDACDGFGTTGYDPDDPLDMGSFQETCSICKGEGAVLC